MARLTEDQIDFLLSFTTDTFNTRVSNVLSGEHILLTGQLLSLTEDYMRRFNGMGTKGINDIKEAFLENGLNFNTLDYESKQAIGAELGKIIQIRPSGALITSSAKHDELADYVKRYDYTEARENLAKIEISSGVVVQQELEPKLKGGDEIVLKKPLDALLSDREKEQLADCTRAFTGLHPCSPDFKKVVEAAAENPSAREAFRRFAGVVEEANASVPANKIA